MRRAALLGVGIAAVLGVLVWLNDPPSARGALPVLAGPSQLSRVDPELSAALTKLGGRRGEVRCWSISDWEERSAEFAAARGEPAVPGRVLAGYLSLDRERVNLPGRTCNRLASLGLSRADAAAAKVFAHELQHFRGVRDEALAECYGIQSIPSVAATLGLRGADARALALTAWTELYPTENPVYHAAGCVNGGPLDLRPTVADWP